MPPDVRGTIELYLEEEDGTAVQDEPAWRAQERQFLWEIVHDTRGILRRTVAPEDVATIRTVEAPGSASAEKAMDAQVALDAYRRVVGALKANADQGPQFHWVAEAGSEAWAAVCHVEADGDVVTVVGGWNRPTVREGTDAEAPTRPVGSDQAAVDVAGTVVRIRRESFYDLFAGDLERLVAVLQDAAERGLRVRFVQR